MLKINYKYINKGSQDIVVFLHGWGLSGESFERISHLINKSSIMIDLFGFGKSSLPKDYFDAYEYSYQIFLFLKKIGVDNIVLVGHSFGGRLAIILSSIFQINIKKLILTSSAGINKFSLLTSIKVIAYKLYKSTKKFVPYFKLDNFFGSSDYNNCSQIMKGVLVRTVNQDLGRLARKIKIETCIVWDKGDKVTPRWLCAKLNKLIVESKVVYYCKGGHFCAFVNYNKFSALIDSL